MISLKLSFAYSAFELFCDPSFLAQIPSTAEHGASYPVEFSFRNAETPAVLPIARNFDDDDDTLEIAPNHVCLNISDNSINLIRHYHALIAEHGLPFSKEMPDITVLPHNRSVSFIIMRTSLCKIPTDRLSGCRHRRLKAQRQSETSSQPQTGDSSHEKQSKEFIRGLMAYIKAHYRHPDAVFLK
jgi:hypothetical protein